MSRVDAEGDQLVSLYSDETDTYLFELDPTINLSRGGLSTLYLPPSVGGERELAFELMHRSRGRLPGQKLLIQVEVDTNASEDENRAITRTLVSERPNHWQVVSLGLPGSSNSVRPHGVRFIQVAGLGGEEDLLIRHLRTRSITTPSQLGR